MRSPMQAHHHRSVLFRTVRIVESANLMFFVGTLLVFGLFVLGNYQEFMDRSQTMLLQLVFFLSLLCVSTGLFYLVSLIVWMIQRRHLLVLRVIYGFVATAIGAAGALGVGLLQAAVQSV
jgi:hypothetical protein